MCEGGGGGEGVGKKGSGVHVMWERGVRGVGKGKQGRQRK
jgi:hypothetical protein